MRPWLALALSLGICFTAAGLGTMATTPELEGWYATLPKPSWNPPNWIFGPVWTMLYAMMAIAAWLVWKRAEWPATRVALGLFALQLALNIAWSWVFFGLHRPDLAFAEIIVLWLAILATMLKFFRHSRIAGVLMLPYLAWVSFASVLNFAIWRLWAT